MRRIRVGGGARPGALGRLGLVLAAAVALLGCDDFHLSASNLEIGPNPAAPGEQMVATVLVSMLPAERHTVTFFVDGDEYLTVTNPQGPAVPVILQLGDASELIAEYGVGVHAAHVVVRMLDQGESARTQAILFELVDDQP